MNRRTSDDIEYIRKVQELGEHKRVVKMCRHMLAKMSAVADPDAVIFLRRVLIDSLTETAREDTEYEYDVYRSDLDSIEVEFDLLFQNHLALQNRLSAARTLLEKATFFPDSRCWDALSKTIELFSTTSDPSLLNDVREAYAEKLKICRGDDPDFLNLCVNYAKFLENPAINIPDATDEILELDDGLANCSHYETSLNIVKSFVSSRGVTPRPLVRILADRYFDTADYEMALWRFFDLLTEENDDRNEYLFMMGRSFYELGQYQNAQMCLHEVIRVGRDQGGDVVDRARELLKEIVDLEIPG